MTDNAKWIWYKSDLEIYTYHKMTMRRRQRNDVLYPTWAMDRPEYQVTFLYEYNVKEDTTFKVYANGKLVVNINEDTWNVEDSSGNISLKKGKGIIRIYCLAENGFPTIFIDSKYIKTNEKWFCYCVDAKVCPVSCLNEFNSKENSPVNFRLPEKKINYKSCEKVGGGILYDFGKEIIARVVIESDKDCNFNVYYGESKEEAVDFKYSEVCETINAKKSVKNYGINALGFRFVFVKNAKSIKTFYALEEKYVHDFTPKFVSNDKELNEIYKTALYTLEVTSREFFIDGPKRDRWVWAGDAMQSIWFDFYSFFDKEIVKRTLTALIGKNEIRANVNSILDYNFYYILSVYYYYYYTGDLEYIKTIFPRLESLMKYVFSKPHKDGFLMAKDEWIFIDWTDIKNFNEINLKYPIGVIQVLYYTSLETMAFFAELLEKDGKIYRDKKIVLKKKINEVFFDDKLGFLHDEKKKCKTKYANIMAVLLNFANTIQTKVIKENFFSKDFYEIYTPFMKFYEMCAVCELGDIEKVISYVKEYWGGMLKIGATTFWERYNPNQKGVEHYEMYNRKYGKSLCHSWGAGPLYLIGKYIVGLKPLSEGFDKFLLSPYLSTITFNSKLHLKDGFIEIKYDKNSLTVYSTVNDGILKFDKKIIDTENVEKTKVGYVIKANKKYVFKIKK